MCVTRISGYISFSILSAVSQNHGKSWNLLPYIQEHYCMCTLTNECIVTLKNIEIISKYHKRYCLNVFCIHLNVFCIHLILSFFVSVNKTKICLLSEMAKSDKKTILRNSPKIGRHLFICNFLAISLNFSNHQLASSCPVCPPANIKQLGSHGTDMNEILFENFSKISLVKI
jgi:hypothetical protein